jgi:hypothetical protein
MHLSESKMPGGIRESLRKHSTATATISMLVAVAALGFSLRRATSGPPLASTLAFYTVDDGQSTFVEEMTRIPPFDHDGKIACRVWMCTCDGGKTRFPGYLERCTPTAKVRIEAALSTNTKGAGGGPSVNLSDIEVKKPGSGNPWVSRANMNEAAKIMHVTCPNGGDLDVVTP